MDNQMVIKRDLKLMQIDEAIREKRNLIINKKDDIKKKTLVNTYLEGVKDDYQRFYNYTVEQKKKEQKAMILLNDYIADLVKTEKLMDHQMRQAKHDQKEIMIEIDKIKGEIDELVN